MMKSEKAYAAFALRFSVGIDRHPREKFSVARVMLVVPIWVEMGDEKHPITADDRWKQAEDTMMVILVVDGFELVLELPHNVVVFMFDVANAHPAHHEA